MKTKILFAFLFLGLLGIFCLGDENLPMAISPGVDGGIGLVDSRCPTFSWAGVSWGKRYQVVVFIAEDMGQKPQEEMALIFTPVLDKEIASGAFSWTPSLDQGLISGLDYVWYVGAMDGSNKWSWSEGKCFRVEESLNLALVEEARIGLKKQGVKDEVINKVLSEAQPSMSGKKPKDSLGNNPIRPLGTEGTYSTFYGTGAGSSNNNDTHCNSFFGSNAGYKTYGGYNTFMGRSAGYSTTDGCENTFMGLETGYANTLGSYNTFIGTWAGTRSTTSNFNTFIGNEAGYANTTGNLNTYIGASAGHANTTGNNNTFIGLDAGYYNTTGSYNTFNGLRSGYWNTTGGNNTFMGWGAGYANRTGGYNTFIGYNSGRVNTEGQSSTFVGINAGYSNSTGNLNTFIGSNAGYTNTTGASNTFIGGGAGYSNSIGYGNVFLGFNAGYNETGSDKLYIDNSDTSLPLIYGDFVNNFIKINGDFQVTGSFSGDLKINSNLSLDNGTTLINSTELNILDGKTLATGSTSNDILVTKGYVDESDDIGGGLTGSEMTDTYLCKWDDANTRLVDSLVSESPGIVSINGWLGVGTQAPAYPMELKTTGRNAAFVANRTDGAVNFMNATATNGQFGTVNNFPVRILVNASPKMTLNADNSLSMASGATCTVGGVWQNASSRSLKENIIKLKAEEAIETLKGLTPVKFNYKADKSDEQVGFIAEDVPDLVATKDRKGMSAMDVVAVLTKVVQEQQKMVQEQKKALLEQKTLNEEQQKVILELKEKLSYLEKEVAAEK